MRPSSAIASGASSSRSTTRACVGAAALRRPRAEHLGGRLPGGLRGTGAGDRLCGRPPPGDSRSEPRNTLRNPHGGGRGFGQDGGRNRGAHRRPRHGGSGARRDPRVPLGAGLGRGLGDRLRTVALASSRAWRASGGSMRSRASPRTSARTADRRAGPAASGGPSSQALRQERWCSWESCTRPDGTPSPT